MAVVETSRDRAPTLTAHQVRQALPMTQDSTLEAGRLAGLGVSQIAGLVLRHWWPGVAVAAPFSRRLRRATAMVAVVDIALTSQPTGLDRTALFAGRRLDDFAYRTGLWVGALRSRSLRALTPGITLRAKSIE